MRRVDNPASRFLPQAVHFDGQAPDAKLEVFEQSAGEILSKNDSRDLPFRYSLNPYRGCYHGCVYCYARPSHEYLDFGAGSDFERKLVVKTNAPERLRQTFERKRWRGERIVLSGNTDCYQPLEAAYELTRRCLQVCLEYRNPVTVITKGALVQRDVDVLSQLAREASARVMLSIPYVDEALARAIEPYASSVDKRFEAMRVLSDAGVETGVAIAPIIVGLNDRSVPHVLSRAHTAGATHAFMTALRLDAQVQPIFFARLQETMPDAVGRVRSALHDVKPASAGGIADNRPGRRFVGQGARWKLVEDVFALHCERLGLNVGEEGPEVQSFERPVAQLELF